MEAEGAVMIMSMALRQVLAQLASRGLTSDGVLVTKEDFTLQLMDPIALEIKRVVSEEGDEAFIIILHPISPKEMVAMAAEAEQQERQLSEIATKIRQN